MSKQTLSKQHTCLICGRETTEIVNDAIAVGGILEDGTRWFGMAYICSWDCWNKFKKRAYEKHSKKLIFKN